MTREEFFKILNKHREKSLSNMLKALEEIPEDKAGDNSIVISKLVSSAIVESQVSLIDSLIEAGIIKFDD